MPPDHQRRLLRQTLVGVVVNLVLSAAIGWLAYRDLARIPLWGSRSIVLDAPKSGGSAPVGVGSPETPAGGEVRPAA
jgi:hypothetical protein